MKKIYWWFRCLTTILEWGWGLRRVEPILDPTNLRKFDIVRLYSNDKVILFYEDELYWKGRIIIEEPHQIKLRKHVFVFNKKDGTYVCPMHDKSYLISWYPYQNHHAYDIKRIVKHSTKVDESMNV